MTFLNVALLGGMAAVAIPVIIHLFHRSKFRIVQWGAMHLLESVLRKNTRRLKLEQLILLLVRCSIPVALALLMARPVITGLEPLLGSRKMSTIVLLDNSYSMEAGGASRSGFLQAKEAVRQILESQVQGSDVAVVRMAGGVSVLLDEPTQDLERLKAEVGRTGAGFGSAAVPDALDLARVLQAKLQNPDREIVVLSDFQKVSWSEAEEPARQAMADQLRRGRIEPRLTLFKVGQETTDNVSVDAPLDLSPLILGVGQRVRVHATVRNHGDAAYPNLRVVFRVDGKDRSVTETALLPRSTSQVLFTHAFDTSGSHVVEVYADADPLQADNGAMASVPVWDRLPVLLVSGDPNPEFLMGETDFAEVALRPYGNAKAELADLISTRTIEARDLDAKALAEPRVALLANVSQLTDVQLKALEAYVREGGGLLVFPGSKINGPWYNSTFHGGGKGLLPLPLASLAGSMNVAGTHASIVAQHFEHPALEMFNDPRNGNLSDAQVRLWYRLRDETAPGKGEERLVTVLARLDTGDAFLVEKKVGEGRVIQACIPCDAEWSNLPVRPFYLPLMQQMTTYLASKVYPPRNVEVGRPLLASCPSPTRASAR